MKYLFILILSLLALNAKAQSEEETVTNMELVAYCDLLPENASRAYVSQTDIEHLILYIRGTQVIIDRDLAMLYQVELTTHSADLVIGHEKTPRVSPRRFRHIEKTCVLYSFTNFKLLTTFAVFTVTKYTPLFRLSKFKLVMPLACWLNTCCPKLL